MLTLGQRHFLRKTDTLLVGEEAFLPNDEPWLPEPSAAVGPDGRCRACGKPQDDHCLHPNHLSYAPMDSRKRCPDWAGAGPPCGPQPLQTQVVILGADLVRKLEDFAFHYYGASDIEV